MPKSKLNQHMDQAHGIKTFNNLIKRSFQPDTPSNFPMKITRPFSDSDPLTLSQEEFNNNNVKDSKGKVKSSQKKAKKRKIETSSDSEDYEEKDLVEDESDDSMKMKTIKPVLDSDSLNLSQEEFITGKSSYGTNQSALLIYGKLRRIESRKRETINLNFILKFLRCSNNLMQKMTSITHDLLL